MDKSRLWLLHWDSHSKHKCRIDFSHDAKVEMRFGHRDSHGTKVDRECFDFLFTRKVLVYLSSVGKPIIFQINSGLGVMNRRSTNVTIRAAFRFLFTSSTLNKIFLNLYVAMIYWAS